MSDALWCRLCRQSVDGLTLYHVGSGRLLVCEGCYAHLLVKERQPYSRRMRQLRAALRDMGREVMLDEGQGLVVTNGSWVDSSHNTSR